ncbi:MAG TPA: DUF2784 domain-containing protein [Candidatus Angelobacter sp.]|nr:DUF2784 domain-containing protein [Candidatus Angelobacter sp.]
MPLVIALGNNVYAALAAGVLIVHAVFILWVVAGALLTRSRPLLRWVHVASLVWGIFILVFPWSCPLTTLENWLESQAGVQPYQGGFLLHYVDALVYPDVSSTVIVAAGVAVCVFNLAVYARRYWKAKRRGAAENHR